MMIKNNYGRQNFNTGLWPLQNNNFLKNMPKVITSVIEILQIILALLKTDGKNQGFQHIEFELFTTD